MPAKVNCVPDKLSFRLTQAPFLLPIASTRCTLNNY